MVFFGLFLLALVGVLGGLEDCGSPAQPIHEPEGVARRP